MASKGKPGMHYRRGGWVKNPVVKSKGGKWVGAAVVVVLLYGWLNGCVNGDGQSAPAPAPVPAPSSSASASR
jgi:hypothetical protein